MSITIPTYFRPSFNPAIFSQVRYWVGFPEGLPKQELLEIAVARFSKGRMTSPYAFRCTQSCFRIQDAKD